MLLLRGLRLRPQPIFNLHARYASRKVLRTFKLADIGEGITECEVIRWSVEPEAKIASFDPLCEVQSDKASVEITSPFDGIVKQLLVEEGKVAKVGQGLCLIEVEEEETAEETGRKDEVKPEQPASQPEKSTPSPPPPQTTTTTRQPHPLDPSFIPKLDSTNDVLAAPSVRHYARSQGVNLAELAPGSGKGGRVEKQDVDMFIQGGGIAAAAATASAPVATSDGKDVVVELGRTRAAMWRAMVKSLEVPHFGYSTTLDITDLHALLPLLNQHIPAQHRPPSNSTPAFNPAHALGEGVGLQTVPAVPPTGQYTRLTYLPFLLKTLATTMMDWPLLRATITATTAKPSLTIRPHADIALALATPTGLYTPVLRATETHNIYTIASDVTHLAALGRRVPSGLTAAHLGGGGTISVSNVGAAGHGTGAMPVLVPGGGVAIVAIGRAEWIWDVSDKYWQAGGARRLKLPVSWSADHRVVEGAELAAFVEAWRAWVENPGRLIAAGV
ncbi:Dihydrolipoamide acetyltransferase component of pyruvate dehydrogenase complex [Mycena indigotica]|uniref:Dihydrolipoamide acetyltransferase component of pyruvate dehydrogenase complex n=1 Tax=Mycena indigotica TaxID=2126181 RepID=A0A8H6W256_9AGAR|nr:Dihydrolipoamide acetyltransferase component of pyruvate dehydrogenase complex [Mycena indigotica]KAF7298908.1 Dihydrolipoamide acetyltransferase component of pyruvate dehydrogenase complex [Mycena indigotica]